MLEKLEGWIKTFSTDETVAPKGDHEWAETLAGLLIEAVTHASISSATRSDNQRLEFLGDRVLGLVLAEALLKDDTDASVLQKPNKRRNGIGQADQTKITWC